MNIKIAKGFINNEDFKSYKSKFMRTGEVTILEGDWEKPKDIRTSPIYISIQQIINGEPFEDTPLFERGKKIIEEGGYAWKHKTLEDFRTKRPEEIKALYHSIKAKGVLSIIEVNEKANEQDNIAVAVGRDGSVYVFDGLHRFAIATMLGIQEIPVTVMIRHSDWVAKRDELRKKIGVKTYDPISHPEFSDIPETWSRTRFYTIWRDLQKEGCSSVLDIGSYYGYFASELANRGMHVTAVEVSRTYFNIMNELKSLGGEWFKTINGSIFDEKVVEYDCILALNIFHHFLKNEPDYYRLIGLLNRMRSKVLYFQVHNPEESQMIGAFKNFNNEEFVQFILDNSNYENVELIGESRGRKIYKFT